MPYPRLASALLVLVAAVLLVAGTGPGHAGDKKDEKKKVELKGVIKTGIFAIGGETTGTIIETKDGPFELDVPKALRKDVDNLNKKPAVVTGTLEEKKGLAVKKRRIVTVETVKPGVDGK